MKMRGGFKVESHIERWCEIAARRCSQEVLGLENTHD
jgi:hypothetical protein